ncbi:MAG TPA: cation diffusion facilitator family transporter [Lapillicoccus sp.]|nr:cation diffusion facilitator family transporter [Lapillicoccus sp.]
MSGSETSAPARPSGGGESTSTVLVALFANLAIALAKGVATVVTGSAAMAAETAHSVADTANQVFLLTALRHSRKPADAEHPLGYGRTRYFWSLLAAGSIFVTGSLYSAYEGIESLRSGGHELTSPLVSYAVLGVALVLESVSLTKAVRQTRREAREHDQGFRTFLRYSDDPTATTVVFEDSAAVIGLVLAAGGIALHQLTGSSVPDAVASLLIAVLLAVVAVRLGRTNMRLLTGVQADPRLVRAILAWLREQSEVVAVVDLLTVLVGTDQVVVGARLDVRDELTTAELERATVRMGIELRQRFPDVAEVFLEPVPRDDPEVQRRVRVRYGDEIADRLG